MREQLIDAAIHMLAMALFLALITVTMLSMADIEPATRRPETLVQFQPEKGDTADVPGIRNARQ